MKGDLVVLKSRHIINIINRRQSIMIYTNCSIPSAYLTNAVVTLTSMPVNTGNTCRGAGGYEDSEDMTSPLFTSIVLCEQKNFEFSVQCFK